MNDYPIIRHARDMRLSRGAVVELGAQLPASEEELDRLFEAVVEAKDESAFLHLVLATIAAGRCMDARHLAAGAELLRLGWQLGLTVFHCKGNAAEALAKALDAGGLTGTPGLAATLLAFAWSKDHPDQPLPPSILIHARRIARTVSVADLPAVELLHLATLSGDEGLRSLLERNGHWEFKALADKLMSKFLSEAKADPIATIPEAPQPKVISGFTVRRAAPRVGRNDPCPCGSGQKYKKCCYDKDQERLRHSSRVAGLTQEELRQTPEVGLDAARLSEMRAFELVALEPLKIPAELQDDYFDQLSRFGQLEATVQALEKLGYKDEWYFHWTRALRHATRNSQRDLVDRLLALRSADALDADLELGTRLLLADPSQRLALVEQAARAGLASKEPAPLVDLAVDLLNSEAPALGILAARSVLPIAQLADAVTVFDPMVCARDRLGLAPEEPFEDLLDQRLFGEDAPAGGSSAELQEAQSKLQAKSIEVRKLTEELNRLHHELELRSTPVVSAGSAPHSAQAAPPAPAASPQAISEDGASTLLRKRVGELREMLKQRHSERNQLRRELQEAHTEIESLRQKPGKAASDDPAGAEGHEDQLLLPAEDFSNQPIRIPDYSRKFSEVLASVPKATARTCLALIGRLGGGEPNAFIGSKRLKMVPGIHRQRVGLDYRLLFRLHSDRLEIIDLINRRDLERRIKALL